MYRYKIEELKRWKDSPHRKPLVVQGARQVGKTWLLKEFGRQCFRNVAYVRLEDNDAMARLFEGSLEPERVLRGIAAATGEQIVEDETLVVLDEVQAVPRALTALKYFCEDAPRYAVAVAGSLLGVALHANISFPVGKVSFMHLYPLTFREFLLALGKDNLVDAISASEFDLMEMFRETLDDLLKTYYFVGGMPEVASSYAAYGDFSAVRSIQHDIVRSYDADFSKHMSTTEAERCRMIFSSLPRHLSKEHKKFTYGTVKKGARGRDLEDALQFLVDAGIVLKVNRVARPGIPLAGYADDSAFKLFCVDVGLLGAMAGVESKAILEGSDLFTHFKGALAEQYVCQQLVSECGVRPFYWSSEKNTSEIDFLYQHDGDVIPIEVKAEENLRSKSLAAFCKTFGLTNAVRLSLSGYREESWMTNVPLYAVSCLKDRL